MLKISTIEAQSIQTFAQTTQVGYKRYRPNPHHETAWYFTRVYRFLNLKRKARSLPLRLKTQSLKIVNYKLALLTTGTSSANGRR